MSKSRVYLISDDNSIDDFMSLNLIPLREMDSYSTLSYKEAFSLDIGNPDVILVYCAENQKEECIKLLYHLRVTLHLYAASIILIVDRFDKEFMIRAYGEEISDYILKDSEKGSTLLKLMWAFRQNAYLKELKKRRSIMRLFGIVDDKTGIFASKHREKIYNHELRYLNAENPNSILLISSSEDKSIFKYDEVVMAVRRAVRSSDIVFQGLNEKIYALLPDTPLNVVNKVFEKICELISNPEMIIGVAMSIDGSSFKDVENTLLSTLPKAQLVEERYVIANNIITKDEDSLQDENWQEWVDSNLGTPKNFKIFKATYEKKKKNIIVPTFYQLLKLYEDKFFETELSQEIGETTSKFILHKDDNESELQINYNGFSKININIIHKGFDSPENQNFEIKLSQITEKYITKLVDDFIKTFVEFYS